MPDESFEDKDLRRRVRYNLSRATFAEKVKRAVEKHPHGAKRARENAEKERARLEAERTDRLSCPDPTV